jgi:hypothetical protein
MGIEWDWSHPQLRALMRPQLGHSGHPYPKSQWLVQGWACDLSQANENWLDEIPRLELQHPWKGRTLRTEQSRKKQSPDLERGKTWIRVHHLSPRWSLTLLLQLHEQKVLGFVCLLCFASVGTGGWTGASCLLGRHSPTRATPHVFCFNYFSDGVSCFCSGWPWTMASYLCLTHAVLKALGVLFSFCFLNLSKLHPVIPSLIHWRWKLFIHWITMN